MRIVPLYKHVRTRRAVLYTDATGRGGCGFVLDTGKPDGKVWSCCQAPAHILKKALYRQKQAVLYESWTAVCAIAAVMQMDLDIDELIVFTDNTATLSLLRNGGSARADLNSLGENMLWKLMHMDVLLVALFVGTLTNLADAPSRILTDTSKDIREGIAELDKAGFKKVPWPKVSLNGWFQ